MKSTLSTPTQAKRVTIIAMVFLASMGLGYSVVKYCITDRPDFTVLLPVFIGSVAVLIMLIGSAKIPKR